jgi:hypothetical protein
METRKSTRAALCGLLFVLCLAACSGESPVATPEGSVDQNAAAEDSPVPTGNSRAAGQAEAVVEATVVVKGTYGSDLTFCYQRGPVGVQLVRRGDLVRGDFSGAAPIATSDQESCDEQEEITGYWEIDVSDPERQDVVSCVVNGNEADTSILFHRDSGIEVECTRAGANSGMLLETTFFVDI